MPSKIDSTLSVELLPGNHDLWLDDFLEELRTLGTALRETERLVAQRPDASLSFKIRKLEKNSPALVELEAVSNAVDGERKQPQFANYVVRAMTANLRLIGNRTKLPSRIDVPTLAAYREMTTPLQKHALEVVVKSGPNSVRINQDFRKAVEAVMGEDEISYGSISGRIEAMNTHGKNRFRLYPVVGPFRVQGTFKSKQRSRFTAGMDKYVTIWGNLRHKTWDKFPYIIEGDDIEVHDSVPPSFLDFKGIAPGATGRFTSADYVNELRDET